MSRSSTRGKDIPIETRLRNLLPETNGATYIGQRMVKLTVEELEEVISTLDRLRNAAHSTRSDREGRPEE